MTDFRALLSKPVDSAEKPKPIPVGTYRAVVKGHEFGESSKNKTPYARFNVQLLTPEGDVDPQTFEEFGGLTKLAGKTLGIDQWLTDDALYRCRQFLEETLKLSCEGRSFGEVIPEGDGRELLVTIAHKPSQDGKEMYANVTGTAAVEG